MGVPRTRSARANATITPWSATSPSYGKPVILSTGMNDLASIGPAVDDPARGPASPTPCSTAPRCIPTPYEKVHLGALTGLAERFPDAVLGLSDHSIGNYTCLAAVALGAPHPREALHLRQGPGPGPTSRSRSTRPELGELVEGSRAVHRRSAARKRSCPRRGRRSTSPTPAWSPPAASPRGSG